MNNKLKAYIDTLFVGAPKTAAMEELKEEMLQNLIDKFQDLIAEGKTEQEAYDIAIASVGDVSDLIGKAPAGGTGEKQAAADTPARTRNGLITAIAVVLYVLSIVPYLFVGNGSLAATLMFCMLALATGLLIWDSPKLGRVHGGMIAAGVALYILAPVAVIALRSALGVVLLFVLLALATGLIIYDCTNRKQTGADASGSKTGIRTASIAACCLTLALMLTLCAFATGRGGRAHIDYDGHVEIDDFDDLDDFDEFDDDDYFHDHNVTQHDESIQPGASGGAQNAAGKPEDAPAKSEKKQKSDATTAATNILAGSGSVPMADVTKIEIDWVAGNVNVVVGDGTDIVFAETSAGQLTDAETMRYRVKDGKLAISYVDGTWDLKDFLSGAISLRIPEKDLTVTIPAAMAQQGLLRELEIDSVSADILTTGVAAQKTNLETVSGGIQADGIAGDELSAETTDGEVALTGFAVRKLELETVNGAVIASGTAQKVDLQSVSGELDVALGSVPHELESEAASGTVTLTLPKDASDFTILMETVSGLLNCGIPTVQSGNRYVAGNGAAKLEFASVSGDVRIQTGN